MREKTQQRWRLLLQPGQTALCFWYLPATGNAGLLPWLFIWSVSWFGAELTFDYWTQEMSYKPQFCGRSLGLCPGATGLGCTHRSLSNIEQVCWSSCSHGLHCSCDCGFRLLPDKGVACRGVTWQHQSHTYHVPNTFTLGFLLGWGVDV
jgi:hypothetical protein